ncbi:hypothetical protein ANCCAN_12345 [Ancylostoma caninum]|uniref:Uncharacterized protein n=1 Tax=Ancylostoma caninum TaxID=29170 RepID=A0A368GFB5_ANCCA|nr:hypothetical protein ANCCAN_12345 [Ancylostoma caninum]
MNYLVPIPKFVISAGKKLLEVGKDLLPDLLPTSSRSFKGFEDIDANIQTERTGVDKKAQTEIFSGYQRALDEFAKYEKSLVDKRFEMMMQQRGEVVKPVIYPTHQQFTTKRPRTGLFFLKF